MADDGYQAGSAYVQILPDFRTFHTKISDALKGEEGTFEKFGDDSGKLFVNGFSERVRVGFADLPHADIKADADTKDADAKLDEAARNRKSTITVKEIAEKGAKLGTFGVKDAAALGGIALGPQALGLGAVAAGTGVAAGASLAGLAAFGLLAKSEVTKVQASAKALATAEAQLNKATTSKQRTAALAAEAAAIKGLSPAEVQLGKDITGLTSAWGALGKAESPVIASALGPWVSAASSGMRLLHPLVNDTGIAVGYLGKEADAAIKSPFWDKFAGALGKTAESGIEGFGDALGHVADGLGHLFVDFAPDIQQLPKLIDGWSKSFDNWAKSYNKSGFEAFVDKTLSKQNMSVLKGDLADVTTILENTGKAGASFSPAALLGLSNILSILAKLSPGQIEAIAALYGATKVVGTAAKAVGAISTVVNGAKSILGSGSSASTPPITGSPAAGEAAGTEAGAEFDSQFGLTVTEGMPEVFAGIGGTLSGESFAAGDAAGASAAAGFASGIGEDLAGAAAVLPEAVTGVIGAAFFAGFAVGGSAGSGFGVGFAAASIVVGRAVGKTRGWVTGAGNGSGSWLVGSGYDAAAGWAQGYASGRALIAASVARTSGSVAAGVNSASPATEGAAITLANRFAAAFIRADDGLTDVLFGAGGHLMSGFLSGLESGFSRVESFVSGIAPWIAAHKGPISYDATLLVPHGQATMGGYYAGLLSGLRPVQDLISGIAPSIAGAAALPGVGRAVQPGAIQLQVSYGASGNALTSAIVTALRFDVAGKAGGDVQRHLGQGPVRVP